VIKLLMAMAAIVSVFDTIFPWIEVSHGSREEILKRFAL
jgi:hypothetical protein